MWSAGSKTGGVLRFTRTVVRDHGSYVSHIRQRLRSPRFSRVEGRFNSVTSLQSKKVLSDITVTPSGIVIAPPKRIQESKAFLPILFTVLGIFIHLRFKLDKNAPSPMAVRPSGRET